MIRQAKKSDLRQIKKLISLYPKVLIKQIPSIDSFFVAEFEIGIVGCCALDVYSQRIAEIRSLAVDEKYWGLRIATKLIKTCLRKAKDKGIHEVFAITSAEKLFNKLGLKTFNKEKTAVFRVL